MNEHHVYLVTLQKRGQTYKPVLRHPDAEVARAVYQSQVWHVAFGETFDLVTLEKVTFDRPHHASGLVVLSNEVVESYGP